MRKLTPEFAYMKDKPIGDRIKLIVLVAAVGFALQLFVSPLVGWFAVLWAALMGRTRSRTNRPSIGSKGDWEPVTIEQMQKAKKLLDTTEEVKSGGAGCWIGCGMVAALAATGALLFILVDGGRLNILSPVASGGSVAATFVLDALTFLLVFSVGGGAKAWEPPNLRTKFDQLRGILALEGNNPQLQFQPNLQLGKTSNGAVPVDLKLMVKVKDAPPNFIGIQIQTSFNKVQGTSYPYTYCVILAKPEFELTRRTEAIEIPPKGGFPVGFLGLFADDNDKREARFARFYGSLVELKKEGEVDIAVVRQDTSEGNEGYTTTPEQALEVFSDAYVLAKKMMGIA